MGRIRTIKPEFPQSESMGRVSRDARLTFILLWTLADDDGRARGSSRMLASMLFPYDDDAPALIDGWLAELERENCIVRYTARKEDDANSMSPERIGHYVQICNWRQHQKIDRPTRSSLPAPHECSTNARRGLDECSTNARRILDEGSSEDQGPRTKDQGPRTKDQGQEESVHANGARSYLVDPSFDERVDAIWASIESIHADAGGKGRSPRLTAYRRSLMSRALDEYASGDILAAWRWAMTSPDFVADAVRKSRGIDTFLQADKLAGYIEAAADPDRWRKRCQDDDTSDPIAEYFAEGAQ